MKYNKMNAIVRKSNLLCLAFLFLSLIACEDISNNILDDARTNCNAEYFNPSYSEYTPVLGKYESIPAPGIDNVPTNQPVILSLGDAASDTEKMQLCENLTLHSAAIEIETSCTATSDKIILKSTNNYDRNTRYTVKHMDVDIINFKTSQATIHQRGKVLDICNPLDASTTHYTYSKEIFMDIRAFFKSYRDNKDDLESLYSTQEALGEAPISRAEFTALTTLLDALINSQLGAVLLDDTVSGDIRYPVNFSKIEYTSIDLRGQLIRQSALIAYPDGANTSMPLISEQHGTISNDLDAPSNSLHTCNDLSSESLSLESLDCDLLANSRDSHKLNILLLALLAYKGAFVVAPDYLGYGSSSHLIHPYLHAESTAASVIDAMLAVKDAIDRKFSLNIGTEFSLSTDNFAGYSQGGSATIAARKIIRERYADEFGLASSVTVAGAGPYAFDESMTEFYLEQNGALPLATRDLLEYALPLLSTLYNIPIKNTDILTYSDTGEPTAFHDSFVASYEAQTETGFQLLKRYLLLNDVYKWKPQTGKIHFVHGTNDLVVPVLNANTAHTYMTTDNAASSAVVTKNISCVATGGHSNCVVNYLRDLVSRITFNQ